MNCAKTLPRLAGGSVPDSPYVGMGNDWANNVDPDGGFTDPVYGIINGVQVVTMNGITSVALKEVVVTGTRAGGAAAAMSIATSTNRAGQQVQGPPDGLLDYSDVVQHMGNRSWTDPSNNKKWYTTYDGVAIEPAPTMGMPPDVGFAPMKFIKFKDVLKKAPDAVKWLRGLSLIKLLDVTDDLIKAGSVPSKQGLTKMANHLKSHYDRDPTRGVFPKLTGNAKAKNAQADSFMLSMVKNPNANIYFRHHANFGFVMEVKVPGHGGARFSSNLKKFIGWID